MPSPVARWPALMAAIGVSAILIGHIPSGQGHITYSRKLQESSMNSPARVIGFVNAAHFIDHYSMLIFAAAVIVMGPALGMAYSELLPYATPGFGAFGAGSLLTASPRANAVEKTLRITNRGKDAVTLDTI